MTDRPHGALADALTDALTDVEQPAAIPAPSGSVVPAVRLAGRVHSDGDPPGLEHDEF
jgi:hypothetical protein